MDMFVKLLGLLERFVACYERDVELRIEQYQGEAVPCAAPAAAEAPKKKGKRKKAEPAPAPEPVAEEPVAEEPVAEEPVPPVAPLPKDVVQQATRKPSKTWVRESLQSYVAAKGVPAAQSLLAGFGVQRVSDIPEAQYAAVIDACTEGLKT